MQVLKWFEVEHGEVLTIDLKRDFGICCGARKISCYGVGNFSQVNVAYPDTLSIMNNQATYEFPVIKGKSPSVFKIYNSQTSTRAICFVVEKLGGIADPNYFINI